MVACATNIKAQPGDHVVIDPTDQFDTTQWRAIGGGLLLGVAQPQGQLSTYFTQRYLFGINIDVHWNRWVLQIDDLIGFAKTRKDLVFTPDLKWSKDKLAMTFMIGGNMGYSVVDNRNIKFVPLAGIGGTIVSSTFMTHSEFSEYEPFLAHYKVGFYVDLKKVMLVQKSFNELDKANEYYNSLRISFGHLNNLGVPKMPHYYQGAIFYVAVGIGGLSGGYKEDIQPY